MSDKEISVGVKADAAGFGPAMQQAANTVRSSAENMRGSLKAATEQAAEASLAMAGFAAALAIGGVLKEMTDHVVEMGTQLAKASQQTGMAASTLSQLSFVAEASDVSFQSLVKGMEMMDRQLLNVAKGTGPAAEAFKILGVSVTDSSGHLKSNDELLTELSRKFSEFADGPEKTALAMRIFGRSGAEMIPVLNQGALGMAKLKADSDALGATMGGDLVTSTEQYHRTMVELQAAFQGIELEMGGGTIPIFQKLGQVVASEVLGWEHGFLTIGLKVQAMASTVGIAFNAAGAAMQLASHGHFKEAGDEIASIAGKVRKEWADTALAIEDDAELTARAIAAINSKVEKEPDRKPAPDVTPDADPKEQAARLAALKEQWKQTEDSIRESSSQTFQDLTAQETAYWTHALGDEKLGATQRAEIRHALVQLDLGEKKRAYSEEISDFKEKESAVTGTAVEQATQRVAITKDELKLTLSLYSANSSEVLAMQRAVAAAERAERTAVAAEEKREAQEQKHDAEEAAKAQLKAAKVTADAWLGFGKQISGTFASAFSGLARGTQTFAQTFRNMTLGLMDNFAKMLINMGVKFAIHEGLKNGILSAGLATRLGLQAAADTAGKVAKTASAVGQVTSDASVGAAGAASAVAAIPIIGPSLAPGAASATFAEIMGFMSGAVASAAGGYDIPAGINPVTQLHAQEMVLPAALAEKVRNSSGGGDHFHFHALDSQSVVDFMKKNHAAVAAAVKKSAGMGGLSLSPAGTFR